MTTSKEIQEVIAKYRRFNSQTFCLLKKIDDLEMPEDIIEECWHEWAREATRICDDICHLWSRIRKRGRLDPLEYNIEGNIKKSLRPFVFAIRDRVFVMGMLRRLKDLSRRTKR